MIGRAAALTNLGDKDRGVSCEKTSVRIVFSLFPVSLCVDATEVAAAANPVFWQEDGSCMSGNRFLRLLLRPEIQLHGDAGKSLPLSPVSPAERTRLRGAEAPNGSRAQRRQREVRRECRNEDFSGCYFARKYNCMGTPKKPPFVKGGGGGNFEKEVFWGFFLPQIQLHGDAEKSLPLSKGGLEGMSNEDFSGCYFARKYNCMGDAEKSLPFVKGRFGGMSKRGFSGCYFARKYNCMGRRRNPTARGFCSPKNGGRAP